MFDRHITDKLEKAMLAINCCDVTLDSQGLYSLNIIQTPRMSDWIYVGIYVLGTWQFRMIKLPCSHRWNIDNSRLGWLYQHVLNNTR